MAHKNKHPRSAKCYYMFIHCSIKDSRRRWQVAWTSS